MEQDVADVLERGITLKQLNKIETRLTGVESAVNQLIYNQSEMKSEIKDSLDTVKIEMEKNTNQVRRLQAKYKRSQSNSKMLFFAMLCGLIIWTIVMNWLKISSL